MKKIKEVLGYGLFIITMVLFFAPGVYWFKNSDLTQMQLLKEVWFVYPIGLFFYFLATNILDDK